MKTFKVFVEEMGYNVPVISIEKTQVNLEEPDTVNEINRNLSLVLHKDFVNVAEGLSTAKKILSMYGIEIEYLGIKNDRSGKIVVPIKQYESSGESHKTVTPPFSGKYTSYFTFEYKLKNGKYEVSGYVENK